MFVVCRERSWTSTGSLQKMQIDGTQLADDAMKPPLQYSYFVGIL